MAGMFIHLALFSKACLITNLIHVLLKENKKIYFEFLDHLLHF